MDNGNQYRQEGRQQTGNNLEDRQQTGNGWEGQGQMGDPPDYRSRSGTNQSKTSAMALASLIMGIIGIVTSCCCYTGLIFGGLGVVFALLSKTGDRYEGYAIGGLITSIIAISLGVLMIVAYFAFDLFSNMEMGGFY